ncbi:TetR/AcrR family transcriptional regulator [Streptomyces sp. SID14478]|uniref:TetR/AcrR family transcriptional regulator n=1 Tax=Streptomyces sp. SID14478 TaxID=2706073 RepID=UPI0013E0AC8C|nr:TetR/AcrR family transcriptional regulator [Streptomyces sp. SID14478]NEB82238.1 TetR/AcrR family transcriptional regulator [Streptomyces sp. SID14478]
MGGMSETGSAVDGRVARGNETRRRILRRTTDIASVEGLDALSIGRIATELKLSKSGVFTLFGSKEELQLATVRAAARIYEEKVVRPALESGPAGVGRLRRLCESWLEYSRERVFPGGCFFYGVLAEYDARQGAVHDALALAHRTWTGLVERCVQEACEAGDLRRDTDAAQLAFELIALMEMANAHSVMHDEQTAYRWARVGIATRLDALAAPGR